MTVVVPFHRDLPKLERCLRALRAASTTVEIIVVADAPVDDCRHLAAEHSCHYQETRGPAGPAAARNRGAARATGNTLVFVDADVEISHDALARFLAVFNAEPDVAAVFGAYDEFPAEQNLISQYKNLAHSYVHQSSLREARSFWAGLGAIRTKVFHTIGGFDERFKRPSIEDIELGYRLSGAGYRVLLEPSIRGCHLKRWDFLSLIRTDVRDRGIPWTQLILRSSILQNDLNVRWTDRASVVLSCVVLLSAPLSVVSLTALPLSALGVALLLVLHRGFYKFFATRRGASFALRVLPLHFLHYICSGYSFAVGSTLFFLGRATSAKLPGTIPRGAWVAEPVPNETSGIGATRSLRQRQ